MDQPVLKLLGQTQRLGHCTSDDDHQEHDQYEHEQVMTWSTRSECSYQETPTIECLRSQGYWLCVVRVFVVLLCGLLVFVLLFVVRLFLFLFVSCFPGTDVGEQRI